MAEEKNFKSVLFGSLAVLAIPAVIYLMGYIYWDEYFSCFGIDLARINLPVYKVMIGATPAFYVVIFGALLVYFVGKSITRTEEGYQVPVTKALFALGLIVAAFAVIVVRPLDHYWMWVLLSFVFAVSLYTLSEFMGRPLAVPKRLPLWAGWCIGMAAIVVTPIVLFYWLQKPLSEAKARSDADKLLGKNCEECSFVKFHFGSDTSCHLPDSLVLIASSELHYFVFSRTERTEGKLRVFAVNKNSVSYIEIGSPKK